MDKLKRQEKIGVSVVIVTFNGKNLLQPTLEHLANQEGIDFEWEVLLVDNNSNDGTVEFVTNFWKSLNVKVPLRIMYEKKQGNMHARFTGIINANYRYILYCDDDNWFSPQYIQFAFNKIKDKPHIAAIGGQGEIQFEKGFVPPDWINQYKAYLACSPQGNADGDTTKDKGCLYTAGTIIDRWWLDKLYVTGFKSVLKGRDGKSFMGGEDTELTYALVLIGGKLYYYADMKFKHFMPQKRINWNYIIKLSKAEGSVNYIIKGYHHEKNNSQLYDFIFTLGLVLKYWFLSLWVGFREGDSNVLNFYRFIGKLNVIRTNYDTQFKIIDWKNSLKS